MAINGDDNPNNLPGTTGDDTINGFGGNDTLTGNAGNDLLYGGEGDDVLVGGAGVDTMYGEAGNDHFNLNSVADLTGWVVDGGIGTDTADLFAGNLRLGSTLPFAGVERLDTYGTNFFGTAGADTYDFSPITTIAFGLPYRLVVHAGDGNDTVIGTNAAWLDGYHFIDGGAGNDSLTGGSSRDSLTGGDGDDTLVGGGGLDLLSGGNGNDTYVVDAAGDIVSELGTVSSTQDVVESSVGWTLGANLENLRLTGTAAINGTGNALANLIGGNEAANRLSGGSGNDTLGGLGGNDTLDGGAGDDVYWITDAGDIAAEAEADAGYDTVYADEDHTLGTGIEALVLLYGSGLKGTGNALANRMMTSSAPLSFDSGTATLYGMAGNDTLIGGGGNDALYGGDGDDLFDSVELLADSGDDLLDGGNGSDTADYGSYGGPIEASLATGLARTSGDVDTLVAIENLSGGSGKDTLGGDGQANRLSGQGGDDKLSGGSGNDTLLGDAGNDTLLGNAGNDTLDGGTGNDTLDGGAGDDLYQIDSAGDIAAEAATALQLLGSADLDGAGNALANLLLGNGGRNTLRGAAGDDTLLGRGGNDSLSGDSGNDELVGGDGADTLVGGTGHDLMSGGNGNDTYVVDTAGDIVSELGTVSSTRDLVQSGVNWTLGANLEWLTLTGTAAITGTGNALANYITGNAAANRLDGSGGNDTLDGAAGTLATEIDTVYSGVSRTLGANLEQLVLLGTAAINGTGNALANYVVGNVAANRLSGGSGNDVLVGDAGNDTLLGGDGDDFFDRFVGNAGVDKMYGEDGNDRFNLNSVADLRGWVVNGGAGADRADLIEGNLQLGATLPFVAVESIDTWKTVFVGTTGGDTYDFSPITTIAFARPYQLVVNAGDGDDTVIGTNAAWADGLHLIRGGNGNDSLTGGASRDWLIGGSGNDRLSGGGGNDVLIGDAGADTLVTGTGSDTVTLNSKVGIDRLTDYATASDTIRISQATLRIGDGDTVVDGGVTKAGSGGFSAAAEVVVFTTNIAGALTPASAAAMIGSATSAYATGATRLFVVDNGADTGVYLFTSSGANALVSATELTQLALIDAADTVLGDYLFTT